MYNDNEKVFLSGGLTMKRYYKSLLSFFMSGIIAISVFIPAINVNASEQFEYSTITLVPEGEVSETGYMREKWVDENGEDVTIPDVEKTKKPVSNGYVEIPSEYSAVDEGYVSSIKDQGDTNSCWAFSAVAAAESSLLKQGLATQSDSMSDLSEAHLVWFTHKSLTSDVNDPTFGDGTNEGAPYTKGGYWLRSTYTLARGAGFALEKDYPFYGRNTSMMGNYDEASRYDSRVTLDEAYVIPDNKRDEIKKAIMDNGSITVAACVVMEYLNKGADGYAYYQSVSTATNHQMIIVGWDDNFAVSNFASDCRPSSPGAWLVKNSYGSNFADNGYFWISYFEPSLDDFAVERVSVTDENESIYQYDGYGYRSARGMSYSTDGINYYPVHTATQSNVFTADANEMLSAVSFYTVQDDVTYTIEVYTGVEPNQSDPTYGGIKSSTVTSGKADYKGYHKINLDKSIPVNAGEKFSVVVTYSISGGDLPVYIPVEGKSGESDGYYVCYNTSENGQSFCKFGDFAWEEYSGNDKYNNVCVKAFTVPDNSLEIRTAEEFNAFAEMVSNGNSFDGKNINLMNDIDFDGGSITPVGTEQNPFSGYFLGNGFVLKNGVVESESDMTGVFTVISQYAAVRKLGVENISVSGVYGVGALCGLNEGTILHCYSTGSVSGEESVGGLVGINCGTISHAYTICDVTGDYWIGSLVGEDDNGTYEMCVVSSSSSLDTAGNEEIDARALREESFSNGQAAFYLDEASSSRLNVWTKRDGVTTFMKSADEAIFQVELFSPADFTSKYAYVSSAEELLEASKAAKPGYYAEFYLDTKLSVPFEGVIKANMMLYVSWKELEKEHVCADELTFIEGTDADCCNDGILPHYECYCGKLYLDETAETEIDNTVIPATGHDYGNWITETEAVCETEGLRVKTCANCGDRIEESIPATGHSYNAVITEPTETEQGYTTYTCTACGDIYITDYVDPVTKVDFKGNITSFLSDTDEITVELVKRGQTEATYSVIITGNKSEFVFEDILSGVYTLKISKNNHTTHEYAVIIENDTSADDYKIHPVGDVTGDGKVNTLDVARANAHAKSVSLLTDYSFACADVNGDGKVNTPDVSRINSHAKSVSHLWK